MKAERIIALLPYTPPFLFVDEITEVSENGIKGHYTIPKDSFFYQGHFKDFPITPGVILTEIMAQIGVVCLGIYLTGKKNDGFPKVRIGLTSHSVEFYKPVLPGEKVLVVSEKIYFRFNKLKCKVSLFDHKNNLVCKGVIAGMTT